MKRVVVALVCVLALALPAMAQDAAAPAPAAPQMDMSKMGGASRAPNAKQEKAVKKELAAFFKAEDKAMKDRDMEACFAVVDFPVLMVTDDAKGQGSAVMMSRDEYVAAMKPFMEQPPPKGMKMSAKRDVTVITESLAVVVAKISITMGKKKMGFKNASMLIKKDGKWLYKMMAEGGWGDHMGAPPAAEPAPEPAPAPAPAP